MKPTRDDHLTVLGDDLSYAVRQALSLREFRGAPGTPWPTAALSVGAVTGAAQLRPPIPESLGDLSADQFDLWVEAMWRQRVELSDLDADMLDWLCAVYILPTRALTLLDRPAHRRCRAGAPVEYLSQRSSFPDKAAYTTPPHPGTKHPGRESRTCP